MDLVNSTRTLAAALALLTGGAMLSDAEARTNRAVLVAVTKYPNVQGADLVGPNNDAQLVREFLTTSAPVPFAPENVTVLADGIDGALASPTRQAILDNFRPSVPAGPSWTSVVNSHRLRIHHSSPRSPLAMPSLPSSADSAAPIAAMSC